MLKSLSTAEAMRYSRHILLSGFDLDKQEVLCNSHALIIGLGGLGCAASQYLVASGIGSLTLIDDDKVETTNLQRQVLHQESSIGELKVDSAASALRRLNTGVRLSTLDTRQSESQLHSLLLRHDIVLDCSDNIGTRNLLNRVCYGANKPLVSGAAIRMEGQVFCVVPAKKSACYACISHLFGEHQISCMDSGVMSPVVGIIGAMQALEAIKLLTNYGKPPVNTLQLFDANTSQWQSFTVPQRHNCEVCGR